MSKKMKVPQVITIGVSRDRSAARLLDDRLRFQRTKTGSVVVTQARRRKPWLRLDCTCGSVFGGTCTLKLKGDIAYCVNESCPVGCLVVIVPEDPDGIFTVMTLDALRAPA